MAREYIATFLGILGICCLIVVLDCLFDTFEDIAEYSPAFRDIVFYFVFHLPGEILPLIPLVAILAVLFSIGVMSKNNEILAMHACGISYVRLCLPVAICATFLSIGNFVAAEWILPTAEFQEAVYRAKIRGKSTPKHSKNVFKPETKDMVYYHELYDQDTDVMCRPVMFRLSPNSGRPVWRLTAKLGQLIDRGEETDTWRFKNIEIWEYDPDTGEALTRNAESEPLPLVKAEHDVELRKHLDKLLGPRRKARQTSVWDLAADIAILRTFGENARVWVYEFHHKLAFPLATLLLTIIGFTISVRAHVRPLVLGFTYGLVSAIVYYLIDGFSKSMGHAGVLSPVVAGWLPNLIFLAYIGFRMRYVNQVRD